MEPNEKGFQIVFHFSTFNEIYTKKQRLIQLRELRFMCDSPLTKILGN